MAEDSIRQGHLETTCWGLRPTTRHNGCLMMMMMSVVFTQFTRLLCHVYTETIWWEVMSVYRGTNWVHTWLHLCDAYAMHVVLSSFPQFSPILLCSLPSGLSTPVLPDTTVFTVFAASLCIRLQGALPRNQRLECVRPRLRATSPGSLVS